MSPQQRLLLVIATSIVGLAIGACKRREDSSLEGSTVASTKSMAQLRSENRALSRTTKPNMTFDGFAKLPQVWGGEFAKLKPTDQKFKDEIFKRYGMKYHNDGTANDNLPMGMIKTNNKLGVGMFSSGQDGFQISCELCHSSSIFGQTVYGIPSPFGDWQKFTNDIMKSMNAKDGLSGIMLRNPPYNTMVNPAIKLDYAGHWLRNESDASLRSDITFDTLYYMVIGGKDTGALSYYSFKEAVDRMPYIRPAAWVTFAAKRDSKQEFVFYHDGIAHRDFNFAVAYNSGLMTSTSDGSDFRKGLEMWGDGGKDYLYGMEAEAPRYPFAIDEKLANTGHQLFEDYCSRCHGSFELKGKISDRVSYPGHFVPLSVVATNPDEASNTGPAIAKLNAVAGGAEAQIRKTNPRYANRTFLKYPDEKERGYVAPPLVRIWARAPYLHNGSIPNLEVLLFPGKRYEFKRWAFAPGADPDRKESYDQKRVGWNVVPLDINAEIDPTQYPRVYGSVIAFKGMERSIVNGFTNSGHESREFFGDLTADQKWAIIEFLKTL